MVFADISLTVLHASIFTKKDIQSYIS